MSEPSDQGAEVLAFRPRQAAVVPAALQDPIEVLKASVVALAEADQRVCAMINRLSEAHVKHAETMDAIVARQDALVEAVILAVNFFAARSSSDA